jgi:hypothetical protein
VARAGHRVPVLKEEEGGWTQVTGRSHQQAVVDQRAAAMEGEEEKSMTEREKTKEKKLLLLYLRDRSLATSDSFSSQVQTIGSWPRGLVKRGLTTLTMVVQVLANRKVRRTVELRCELWARDITQQQDRDGALAEIRWCNSRASSRQQSLLRDSFYTWFTFNRKLLD